MRLVKGRTYKVTWKDIHTNNDWLSLDDVFKEVKQIQDMVNIWTYLGQVPDWYIFSSSVKNKKNDAYFDWAALPKKCIVTIKEVKENENTPTRRDSQGGKQEPVPSVG